MSESSQSIIFDDEDTIIKKQTTGENYTSSFLDRLAGGASIVIYEDKNHTPNPVKENKSEISFTIQEDELSNSNEDDSQNKTDFGSF